MELCVPIYHNGKIYTEAEIGKLKNGVIADATEEMARSGDFSGMLKLITGTLKTLSTEDGEVVSSGFEPILRDATIQTAEILALKALTQGKDESLEQISVCPRCGNRKIYEDEEALRFEDLELQGYTGAQIIEVPLDEPINIINKQTKDVLMSVESLTLRYPTLQDGINGSNKVPAGKRVRRTLAIYSSAITHINGGEEVEPKFRKSWGMYILERMCSEDIGLISETMSSCGIKKTVERECNNCGKKWNDPIDVSGFFESGLRQ